MTTQFLFFPFTHITQNQLETLLAFFPSFQHLSVSIDYQQLQPLQTAFEQGKINPVFTSAKELAAVEQKIREYLAWAQINKGNEHNFKSLLKDNPYFTSHSDVSAITSQIRGAKEVKKETGTQASVLQRNLLFLRMANLCDEQNENIDIELKNLDKTRDTLISDLRGLDSPLEDVRNKNIEETKDTGTIMTRERIEAWSGYLAQKGGLESQGGSPIFVTTSEAVFSYLESICKDVINALDINRIKVHENNCKNKNEWQSHFSDVLMRLIQGKGNREAKKLEVNDECSLLGQMKLAFFSGDEINSLFNMSDIQIPVCLIKLK